MTDIPRHLEAADELCNALATHPALTLLLDLDGTLIPYASTPEGATLDARVVATLGSLVGAGIRVVVVSGRPRDLLEPFAAAMPEVIWIAEHGTALRTPGGSWLGSTRAPEVAAIRTMLAPFALIPGIRIEEKALSVCVHWRLVPHAIKEQTIAAAELACDEWLESNPAFERLEGVETLELRKATAHKGLAVAWLRATHPDARAIAIGDDTTDEDMFAALHTDELAIGVGDKRSRVACSLADHDAVHAFLAWLVETRRGVATQPFLARHSRMHRPARSGRTRLLVVSNRTPPPATGKQRSVGGLVSALEPALRTYDGMWLGWSGHESSGDRRVTIDDLARPVLAAFDFPPTWRERFYGGFCNRSLWPVFHGFPGRAKFATDEWTAYVEANQEFARRAHELVHADGTVWMHDYHLLLAGQGLRDDGFAGPLGLFLHIPFPQRDLLATLPWARELVEAMTHFDLVGFHTQQWADNFRECVRTFAPSARMPQVGVLPIGVDPVTFSLGESAVDREVAGLRAALGTRRMVLGVDRLDYAKGIPERLLAYEHLLETKPEWRGAIVFVQISVPSRADVPEYAELKLRVENLVGRINGRFGEADWVPVRYLYRSYDHGVLAQLYRSADVALVTPLRDGLNLVAKEFVHAQDGEHPGVLVLSKFAGAAAELHDAILTNPYHPDGLAADLDRALRMELPERRRRHALLVAALGDQTPQRWAAMFLDRLARAERYVA